MKAILVCVDYSDYLSLTLPYNCHHFSEIMVITTPADRQTQETVASVSNAKIFCTNSFYDNGAYFNKWKALEQGLDALGRDGIICIMDADIFWPKQIPEWSIQKGNLYTPFRRMGNIIDQFTVPAENEWIKYRRHRIVKDWSGYSQIFHADDPHLGPAPWHQIDWKHAGGADTFFQEKWLPGEKIRPPFEVLHVGPAGQNWCGRSTPYLDGSMPADGLFRAETLEGFMRQRRSNGGRYDHERYPPSTERPSPGGLDVQDY